MFGYSPHYEQECTRYKSLKEHISPGGRLMSIGRLLEYAYNTYPHHIALLYKDEKITYEHLYLRANAMAHILISRGVKARDKVLLLFDNSPAFYIGYYGILHARAIVVPLNTFLHSKELAHIIQDADPTLIMSSKTLASSLTDCTIPILTEDDMPLSASLDNSPFFSNRSNFEPNDLAVLLYTSGTTGLPKGVMLSSKNCMTNVLQAVARIGLSHQERIFGALPMFHSFAQSICVWVTLFLGCTVIVVPKIDRRSILEGLRHKPTIFCGVPALYGLLCLLKTAPLDSVEYFICGGDALPDKIRSAFALVYGRKICNGYGLTEASPLISVNLRDSSVPTNTVGRALCGIEISIRDEQGAIMSTGEIGQLWIKGDNVMLGYYKDQALTDHVLQKGWLHTGDLAYQNQDQELVITGRAKDLIIHKGFNIYPQEIENILMSHPNVLRAAVIGKIDTENGQIPIAYIQLKQEQNTIEQELKHLCLSSIATYKIPKKFICSTRELPLTTTGKVDKKRLHENY